MDKPAFKQAFGRPLLASGFARAGQTWFLRGSETIALANLQKSNYSDLWFLNLGFWLHDLGTAPLPLQEKDCHFRIRADAAFPQVAESLCRVLDLDHAMADSERASELAAILSAYVIPFLRRGTTRAGLIELWREGHFANGLVRQSAQRLLQSHSSAKD